MTKIPKNAKRVFKGVLFDVFQWEQQMFDQTTETFEAIKRKHSVQIIAITSENKIIMLDEEQPFVGTFTSIPGGVVDENESCESAAKRELLEESGYVTENLIKFKEVISGSKIDWITYYYIAKNCTLKTKKLNLDSGEKIKIKLVEFSEFLDLIEQKKFRNKQLSDIIFRIKHTSSEFEKFKEELFN